MQQTGTKRTLGFIRKRGDEFVQTIVDLTDPDVPAHSYVETMTAPFMVVDDPRRLLVVGLGGGTMIRYLHSRVPAAQIDAVEIDPEVVRLAGEWFGVVPGRGCGSSPTTPSASSPARANRTTSSGSTPSSTPAPRAPTTPACPRNCAASASCAASRPASIPAASRPSTFTI
ncbi:spermidine synthase [Nannocystis pusilla]|uniref:spermidine synthase n=1 Tax=Nannocystis pusilla TaxID=889268 RepID=UPI003B76591D